MVPPFQSAFLHCVCNVCMKSRKYKHRCAPVPEWVIICPCIPVYPSEFFRSFPRSRFPFLFYLPCAFIGCEKPTPETGSLRAKTYKRLYHCGHLHSHSRSSLHSSLHTRCNSVTLVPSSISKTVNAIILIALLVNTPASALFGR